MKARAEELSEGYQEARNEAFNDEFFDILFPSGVNTNLEKWKVTEDDIQGFLDSFTFEDEADWAWSMMESELDDIGDQQYEQMRDEKMGL